MHVCVCTKATATQRQQIFTKSKTNQVADKCKAICNARNFNRWFNFRFDEKLQMKLGPHFQNGTMLLQVCKHGLRKHIMQALQTKRQDSIFRLCIGNTSNQYIAKICGEVWLRYIRKVKHQFAAAHPSCKLEVGNSERLRRNTKFFFSEEKNPSGLLDFLCAFGIQAVWYTQR